MSEPADPTPPAGGAKSRRKRLLLATPVVLLLAGSGAAWRFLLPHPHAAKAKPVIAPVTSVAPIYAEMPDIIANLDTNSRRQSFIKLKIKLELAHEADRAAITAAMPRLEDIFTTYLRDIHPDELRGSEGTYRLREAMLNRALIAAAPAAITDILFVQMIVQ